MREDVVRARQKQAERFTAQSNRYNAQMISREVRERKKGDDATKGTGVNDTGNPF